jgi:hypothetical protein
VALTLTPVTPDAPPLTQFVDRMHAMASEADHRASQHVTDETRAMLRAYAAAYRRAIREAQAIFGDQP